MNEIYNPAKQERKIKQLIYYLWLSLILSIILLFAVVCITLNRSAVINKQKSEIQCIKSVNDSLVKEIQKWENTPIRMRRLVGLPDTIILTPLIKKEIAKQKIKK